MAAPQLVAPPVIPIRTEEERKPAPTSVRLRKPIRDAAGRLAAARGYSRNHVLAVLVEWGLQAMASTGNAPELEGLLSTPAPALTPRQRGKAGGGSRTR